MRRKIPLIVAILLSVSVASGAGWLHYLKRIFKADDIFVVVLEHNWEESLQEPEYSEGEMLRAFLAPDKHAHVRHRFYTDHASLRKWCLEVGDLPGPVVLVFADHGSPSGLYSDEGDIGARAIADSLRDVNNLKMIHFSACSTFRGHFPADVITRMGKDHAVPITGYLTDVDWSISSLVDFMLIHLVVTEHDTPFAAWVQTKKMMPIAGLTQLEYCPHKPLGLFIVMPEWIFKPLELLPLIHSTPTEADDAVQIESPTKIPVLGKARCGSEVRRRQHGQEARAAA